MIRPRDVLAFAASATAPWLLPAVVALVGAAFLVGGSCAAQRAAVKTAEWQRKADDLTQQVVDVTAYYDSLAAAAVPTVVEHTRTVTRWRDVVVELPPATARESTYVRVGETVVVASDSAVAALTRQALAADSLVATLRAALAHEREKPAAPRFSRRAALGYEVAVRDSLLSAPFVGADAAFRLTARASLAADASYTLAPIRELRARTYLSIAF